MNILNPSRKFNGEMTKAQLTRLTSVLALLVLAALLLPPSTARAQGTAFTYQGQLFDNGIPANGNYAMQFKCYDSSNLPYNLVSQVLTLAPVTVSNGLFAVLLDFGPGEFAGAPRWLQISAATNSGSPLFQPLAPRQLLTPAPYAIFAETASNLSGTLPTAQLSGTVLNNQLANNSITVAAGAGLSVGGSNTLGSTLTLTNTGVLSVTGNADITASPNTGNVILGDNATSAGTPSTLMKRDATGSFAGTLIGNATTATTAINVMNGAITPIQLNTVRQPASGQVLTYNGTEMAWTNSATPWNLTGNIGTSPTNGNFVGTSDQQPLELWADGMRALRIEPDAGTSRIPAASPNLIGGSKSNAVAPSSFAGTQYGGGGGIVIGATIAGGGDTNGEPNTVADDFDTISGGRRNSILGSLGYADNSTIAGGFYNLIDSVQYSTIGGGYGNLIQGPDGVGCIIGGGSGNIIKPQSVGFNFYNNFIGGGEYNLLKGNDSIIGGGQQNTSSGSNLVIGGGRANLIEGEYNAICGGLQNSIFGGYDIIGGGNLNSIQSSSTNCSIGGGNENEIQANSSFGAIGGGSYNIASGYASTIPGGSLNSAAGNFSFASGSSCTANGTGSFALGTTVTANEPNTFIWGDGSRAGVSQGTNSFTVLATGGVWFFTGPYPAGMKLAPGSSSWATLSDRNYKKNIMPLDYQAVLNKLAGVPISHWNYKWEKDGDVPNLGPMAQDFKHAFYPGRDDKSITTLEFDGVELAAIQGLNQKVDAENAALRAENANLKQQLEAMQSGIASRLARLEKTVARIPEISTATLATTTSATEPK